MKADPNLTINNFLLEWMDASLIDEARLKVQVAIIEYHELIEAGTQWDRVKLAEENLQAIEDHARALSRAIKSMPNRARSAIWEHQFLVNSGETGTIKKWLDDLNVIREDVILPLIATSRGARACLPAPPPRGRPPKSADNPLHELIRRLAKIHQDYGDKTSPRKRGEGEPEKAFIREILDALGITHPDGIKLPDDLARVLRQK